tara:strand:+ start:402 stop:554 length:153 start_codon:yes stop_codon:yes gene_type:complete
MKYTNKIDIRTEKDRQEGKWTLYGHGVFTPKEIIKILKKWVRRNNGSLYR